MKSLVAILLTLFLGFIAGIFLPWWGIAVVAFLVAAFIRQPALKSFLCGFAGIFILWGLLALWIDVKNNSILSHKIALLLPLGGSSALLILVTALIGALVGGLAALSGSLLLPAKSPRAVKRKQATGSEQRLEGAKYEERGTKYEVRGTKLKGLEIGE